MRHLYESDLEQLAIETLQSQGYTYLTPESQETERPDLSEVVLKTRLREAINRINKNANADAKEQALKAVLNFTSQNLVDNNETFHRLLTEGINVEVYENGETVGQEIKFVDFEESENNEFLVCNQFTVLNQGHHKRPDIVLLVNGLPLVVIELKNLADEQATVKKAFMQLQNYQTAIPQLFNYNVILVASDGLDARVGSLTSPFSRFLAWKTVDGKKEDQVTVPQLETLINGMLKPEVLLDLIKNFTVFEKTEIKDLKTGLIQIETVKKIAAYHQYHAVNKAVFETQRAAGFVKSLPTKRAAEYENGKVGVVWHTQGSGKSLSMVFYSGKIVQNLDNPTLVVITDRNDLDEQLFDTFAACKQLLRQTPVQAETRDHLKELLKTAGGGIIFTTIQKFSTAAGITEFDLLSERRNIVVVADEAHRSQYGFGAKTLIKDDQAFTKYGFAKYLRDALPNASFIGFTGTPIEKADASTPAVFGNYIDIYDIQQAVEDGATVRIYYESRLAKVHLKPEALEGLDEELNAIGEGEENLFLEKTKSKWTRLEAIVGNQDRLKNIAKDIIEHFETKQTVAAGKAMIVAMSRRIAVELYEEIIKLRPEWHSEDKTKGVIKVVMTSSSSDPAAWQKHHTSKQDRKALGDRLKKPDDALKLVIVRDMWLTGFDAPCLNTLYVDKPMQGHNLMQAIARVNRVYGEKPGGFVVDYIGIASDLKSAVADYTESGGRGLPVHDEAEAIAMLHEKFEIVAQMFNNFDYKRYFAADTRAKMTIILEAQEYILALDDGKNRFMKQVNLLSKAFSLAIPHEEAMKLKDEVAFFQIIKARLAKFDSSSEGKDPDQMEEAIRHIIDKAVVADGVVDIFDAAGIKKPDISILSEEFLAEIKGMERKNLAMELLKKLLNDEIKTRSKQNFVQSRKFSEMLEMAVKRYQNNLISAAEVIEELIKLAEDMKSYDQEGVDLGLTPDERAFYDALANSKSAKEVLGDKQLAVIAMEVLKSVKGNATIDWNLKENVRAKLRRDVKRILNRYGYPPDEQLVATENVLKQAELLAEEWADA
jgi:type I restriction enzyme R subunit